MTLKPAYVVGGPVSDSFLAEVAAGQRPELEFLTFTRRQGGPLLGAAASPPGQGKIGRKLVALKLPHAWDVAGRASAFSALVTSGEDIGIPLAVALWLRRDRTPLLMQVHGHYLGGKKFALVAPLLRSMAQVQFLALSASIRDRLIEEFGFPAARCHSVGYGVDTDFFTPAPEARPATERPLIVGAGLANRDYDTLVTAVAPLPVKVRVAAASPWMQAAVAERPNLPAHVEFRSAGDYLGLRALYAGARCVVVPMHAANHACGYAVMAEAMAMGTPVIATRLAAPCDFFEDGVHGIYVEPSDVEGLRAAIARLADDPELATQMGQAARRRMEEAYTLAAFCERIEARLP